MEEIPSQNSDDPSEPSEGRSKMAPAAEAQHHLLTIAGPQRAGVGVKATLNLLSRQTGFGFSRIKALWYGEARVISSAEMDTLREAAAARSAKEAVTHANHQALMARILLLERDLASLAADRAHDRAAVVVSPAGGRGRKDNAVVGGR